MNKEDLIWKALSDPARRKLLDALRSGPKTTGDLCRPFRTSRYAVMKHLTVLEAAGLVLVRREGRERWNHLNAVPLRRIYEKWVSPFQSHWSEKLLRLEAHLEDDEGGDVTTRTKTLDEWGVARIELEIAIRGTSERVWKALIEETSLWWNRDFYTSPSARGFVIEPHLGGRAYEDWGNGAGQVWYTVVGLEPGVSLRLLGHLSPAFGGPATTQLELRLKGSEEGTTLQLSDTIYGRVDEKKTAETRDGWSTLFDEGLRAWVESRTA
jgi:DNA-binding transcriptional ArsR family regulator